MTRREHDKIVGELIRRHNEELAAVKRITLQQFADLLGRPAKSVQVAISRDKDLAQRLGAELSRYTFNEQAAKDYAATRYPGRRLRSRPR